MVNVKMQKLQKKKREWISNKANKMSSVVLVASLTRSTSSAKVFIPCKLLTTLSVKSVPYVQLSAIPASALSFLLTSTILGTTLRMFSWTYHSPTVGSLHVAKKKSLVTCPTVWHLFHVKKKNHSEMSTKEGNMKQTFLSVCVCVSIQHFLLCPRSVRRCVWCSHFINVRKW